MSRLFIILSVTLLTFSISGCKDSEIDPFEDEIGVYSIYGAMDLHDSLNVIRVRDLNTFFNSDSSKYLDATVTFFDIQENTSQILKDSVVQFPTNYTHNFMLKKHFEPSSPYRVEVERSDGVKVSSNFTTPGITETKFIHTGNRVHCYTPIQFVFKNVLPDEQIRIDVGVNYQEKIHWIEFTGICITEYIEERHELVITAKPYLLLDFFWPKPKWDPPPNCRDPRYPTVLCDDLSSDDFIIRYLHLGPEWMKIYPVRPRIPDEVGDVENGLGFLGAFRQDTLVFTVDTGR